MRVGMIRHYWWDDFHTQRRFITWILLLVIFYAVSVIITDRFPNDWHAVWFFFWSGLTLLTFTLLLFVIEKAPGCGRYLCTVGILMTTFFSVVPTIAVIAIFKRRVNAVVVTVIVCDTVTLLGHILFFLGLEIYLRCRRPTLSRRYRGRSHHRRQRRLVVMPMATAAAVIDLCSKIIQPDPELGIDLTCSICRFEIEFVETASPGVVTPCSHRFHTKCLTRWFESKTSCPNCQQEIKREN